MTDSNKDPKWGFHLNDTTYSISCPPCPKWANSWEQQNWHKLGVIVWDARINRVTHLHGSQAVHILEQSRQSDSWKKEGLLVGEVAYRFTIPSDKKSKSKIADQFEPKLAQEEGWCLTNTIQLVPDQAQQFITFLEQHKANLEEVIIAEAAERRKILVKAYSLILSWGDEREKGGPSIKTSSVQETKSVSSHAFTIPNGKYLTIAQVAEICGMREKSVSAWLKKGLLKSLDLPGLGQIVEEKDLEKYLANNRNRS
jgi:hypothetical protein